MSLPITLLSKQLNIPVKQIENTLKLFAEGGTVPFIARYRKEATGGLDEVQISDIKNTAHKLEELEKRRQSILQSIEEQGKMTDALKRRILETYDSNELEDLYLPYKRKRKTRASIARERGLEPLAMRIMEQFPGDRPEQIAEQFVTSDVPTVEDALQGARDIVAELVNEDEQARNSIRQLFDKQATVRSKVARGKEEEGSKYKDYFGYEEPLRKIPSHRLLAIRRGEEEGFLRVVIEPSQEDAIEYLEKIFIKNSSHSSKEVKIAIADAYDRLLAPSIETEFRNSSKEKADKEAIDVFAGNLRQLLLAAPLGQCRVLAIDPGFRTGCKVVCLGAEGDLLANTAIYPHPPQHDIGGAKQQLQELVQKFGIEAIAIGNGTASRETTDFVNTINFGKKIAVFVVSENGASIYSASDVAREEFPEYDVTVRGAISIGRRLMDPLAELVKIDPKSIGVGQYQHDVNQAMLKSSLDTVVESCVNAVGINLNTASKHLLNYVSGLGPKLAQSIVDYRAENGPFYNRENLKKVPRLGDKAFEQCAGFLRIRDAANPLDNTAVHPESYPIVERMAADMGSTVYDLIKNAALRQKIDIKKYVTNSIGIPTLKDILQELAKPGLDPRGEAKAFEFDENIKGIGDLREGMVVPGIITNITKFGAFVDIGIKEGCMVHISEMANRFVKDPNEVVKLQQQVSARVISIDLERGRVALSLRN
jgi:uncharacterized protein